MKRPIVASRSGAIPEVIREGESGLLVDPGSPEQIYEALVRLLEDERLRERLGEGAYRRAQMLSPQAELDNWLAVYRTVLGVDEPGPLPLIEEPYQEAEVRIAWR